MVFRDECGDDGFYPFFEEFAGLRPSIAAREIWVGVDF
jgi:hypothetical protein